LLDLAGDFFGQFGWAVDQQFFRASRHAACHGQRIEQAEVGLGDGVRADRGATG